MNLKEWLKIAAQKLPYQECAYLAKAILGITELTDQELPRLTQNSLETALKKRITGIPLAKITGKKHFMNDWFLTNKNTLDPRPETEYLIEKIGIKPRTVLELGIGTGCLLFSILKQYPKAKGTGIDISQQALQVAAQNAQILNLTKRTKLIENNWANGITGDFDLIVSNPPYVDLNAKLEEARYDPATALFGNEETYAKIFNSLTNITFQELLLEIPENLLSTVLKIAPGNAEYEEIYNSKIYCMKITM